MSDIIGKNFIKLDLTDSTNNYAINNLDKENWVNGTVILCNGQTAGRGQINNKWESEYGKNLLLSIVLYPNFLKVQHQFRLSKAISLGICNTFSLFVNNATIKWPNDIYVNNLKAAGILIENSIMGNSICSSVVGIGINLNQEVFNSNAPNPVSLMQLLNYPIDREEFASLLFSNLNKWYNKLKEGLNREIDIAFLKNLYLIDQDAEFSDKNGKFIGKIVGVNETGQLIILKASNELAQYHFKEVEFKQ